jgi:hypothetical protein
MIRLLVLVAGFWIAAASPVVAWPREVWATFNNRSSHTYDFEVFDASGSIFARTTLVPGGSLTTKVPNGEARIYSPAKELSLGKPVATCKIVTNHVQGARHRLEFEIREQKIIEFLSHK